MRSSAIVALFEASLTSLGLVVLSGLFPLSARAESAQLQSVGAAQAVAAAEPHSDSGAATGASTVLKTPTVAAEPAASSAAIPPIPSSASQSPTASVIGPVPSKAASGLTDAATPSAAAGATATKIGTVGAAPAASGANAASAVQSRIDSLELLSPLQRRTYQRAASVFTAFCRDWERLLHEREVNNLEHLSWQEDGGLEMATYTGYGKVESCECKASKEGLPIGKIRYEEILYSIAGKTVGEARHAAPKLMHEINTLEIFSWDKGKWFY